MTILPNGGIKLSPEELEQWRQRVTTRAVMAINQNAGLQNQDSTRSLSEILRNEPGRWAGREYL